MFFLISFLIILIIFLCLITIKIKFRIINFEFNTSKGKGRYINEEFLATITINILEKIPIWKIKIDKAKLKKIQNSKNVNKLKNNFNQKLIENKNDFDKDVLFVIYKFPISIYNTNTGIEIGTESMMLTTFLIPIISTFLALIYKRYAKGNNIKFNVKPIYNQKNVLKLEFNGIFEIKMIHIINTICILKNRKRRVKSNVRTSNRRSYDYSYE